MPEDQLNVRQVSQGVTAPAVTEGTAILWTGSGGPTFSGNWAQAFITWELEAVPGVRELGYDSQPAAALGLHQAAEGMLASIGAHRGKVAAELRYLSAPGQQGGPQRVRLFLTVRAQASRSADAVMTAQTASSALRATMPPAYKLAPANLRDADPLDWIDPWIIEVRREENVVLPQVARDSDYFYVAYPVAGDGSGWPRFLTAMANVDRPVCVSLLFIPTELDVVERTAVDHILTGLRFHASPRVEPDVAGISRNIPGDGAASDAQATWERWAQGVERCFLVRACVVADKGSARQIASALSDAASAVRAESPERRWPMATQSPRSKEELLAAQASLRWLTVVPWGGHTLWQTEGAPHMLRRIPYLLSTRDAASLAILPVPDEQGAPGFVRARRASARRSALVSPGEVAAEGVVLGRYQHEGSPGAEAVLPLAAINRHVLVVGAPGSGKTTTVHTILHSLWCDYRIPWLTVEPVKTEYRSLLKANGMEALRIFTLGDEDVSPLRLNPLAPPPHVRCETHISSVMACLKMALPLFPPLPQILAQALDHAYEQAGWEEGTTSADGLAAPTIRDLLASFDVIFERVGYQGQARDVGAAARVRLKSLLRGSLGRMLDTVESTDFADLMRWPVVVELDAIADSDDKAVLSAFLLDRIRAAAKARSSTGGQLKHVTVIEEAHRLLSKTVSSGSSETGGDPRAEAGRAFTEAIAELRALGEGFVLSSQSPSRLADAAVANSGTRIVHRLESADDRDAVLDDFDASPELRSAAARLRRGEAVVRFAEQDEAALVQVVSADGVDSGCATPDDLVAASMAEERSRVEALLPYPLCTRDVCHGGCNRAVRSRGRRIAGSVSIQSRAAWEAAAPRTAAALSVLGPLLASAAERDMQTAYCGAVHLAVSGDAFVVPLTDIRQQLAEAIAEAVEAK